MPRFRPFRSSAAQPGRRTRLQTRRNGQRPRLARSRANHPDTRPHDPSAHPADVRRVEQALRESRQVLDTMFETMEEAVSVFDADLRLVAVNQRYRALFDLPPALYQCGTPFEHMVRHWAERGDYGPGEVDAHVRRRMDEARRCEPAYQVRERPDGRTLEVRRRRLPGGGMVTVHTDITQRAQAERALRQSQRVLQNTFEHMDQGIAVFDGELRSLGANRRFQDLLDLPDALCRPGTPFEAIVRFNAQRGDYGPCDVEQLVQQRVALARSPEPHRFERQGPDGTVLEIRRLPVPDGGFVSLYTDVTQRAHAERALRASEARFRQLTELSSDWFWEMDAEGRLTRIEGHHQTDPSAFQNELGRTFWELGFDVDGGWDAFRQQLAEHQPFRERTLRRPRPDGELMHVRVSGAPILGADGRPCGWRGVARDTSRQQRDEERIRYLATHDGLTGLPNRTWFGELVTLALHAARRYGRTLAVLFIDLDRFKLVNDTLGHEAGDELLKEVARRLKTCLRASDVVARLGGDEFVVLLPELPAPDHASIVARKILAAVLEPIVVQQQICRVTASVGVALYPQDAADEATLMKNADIAMYQAKEEGKNNFQFYSPAIKTQSLERLALETALRNALPRSEFSIHYQARLNLKTNTITGVEALLRWHSADLGSVSPAQFIPVAEQTGLIVPIGRWVLQTACAQNVAWQREGLPPMAVSVNLSARQFQDEGLLADLAQVLQDTGLAPELLELEITEGMVMHDMDRALMQLHAIKQMGVRIAIDDFGTGYSSLAQVKRFPIDALKVDRSFIRDVSSDGKDRAITEAIIAIGRTLHLTVVAEGVETAEQQTVLRDHGCDEIQGYYFSKPVPPAEVSVLLRRHLGPPPGVANPD